MAAHCVTVRKPSPATLTMPAGGPVVARIMAAVASSSWMNWNRASKPSGIGTSGSEK